MHIARAKASRATPAAPAPTATPALPATERPSVVGAAPALAVEEAEADEDADVFVLVLVSEPVSEDEVSVDAEEVVEVYSHN